MTDQEIYDQCSNIINDLELEDKPLLFSCMGVGEPLLNYHNVVGAFKLLSKHYPNDKYALATTGIKPKLLLQLASDLKDIKHFKLTISLHAVNNKIRKMIIPNSIPIEDLVVIGKKYKEISGRTVEWNYVLLNNINDNETDASDLIKLLGKNEYVKLNKFNPVEVSNFSASTEKTIDRFCAKLEGNIQYEYYQTNGSDIMGACGQWFAIKI